LPGVAANWRWPFLDRSNYTPVLQIERSEGLVTVSYGVTLALDLAGSLAVDLAASLEMLSTVLTTVVRKPSATGAEATMEEGAGTVSRIAQDWLELQQAGAATSPFQTY
jgi:hypothetical protein